MSYTCGTSQSRQNSTDNRNWPAVIVSHSICTPMQVDVRQVDQFYDHVEAHMRGFAKVLKPMIEINNIIINECRHSKSADHHNRGKLTQSDTKLSYYTPQRIKSGETTSSGNQSQHSKYNGDLSGRKLTSDNSYNRSTNKSTYRPLSEASCSTTLSVSKKENNYSKDTSQRFSTSTENQSFPRPQAKSSDSYKEYVSKNCSICGIDINKVKVMAQVPCKHTFCYPCMSRNELTSCPKCWKPLKRDTIKNITTI